MRIRDEFRFLNLVRHPNIVAPGTLGHAAGHWHFSMQLAGNQELLPYVRSEVPAGSLPDLKRFAAALAQLTSALAAIHDAGLVHCDVKPSNVRVDRQGRLLFFDFGSVIRCGGLHCLPTLRGELACTFQYLAPETVYDGVCGPPADVFALGRICFELLTGRRANVDYAGMTDTLAFRTRLINRFPADTPAELRELVAAMMAIDPLRRPTATDLVEFFDGTPSSHAGRLATDVHIARVRQAAGEVAEGSGGQLVVFAGSTKKCRQIARQCLDRCSGDVPLLTVLGGDCNREKFDGAALAAVSDGLARWYDRLPDVVRASLFPDARHRPRPYESPSPEAAEDALSTIIELSRRKPMTLLIERLDCADAVSRDVLRKLMHHLPRLKLLVLGTSRTTTGVKWLSRARKNTGLQFRDAPLQAVPSPMSARYRRSG